MPYVVLAHLLSLTRVRNGFRLTIPFYKLLGGFIFLRCYLALFFRILWGE